MLDNDNSNDISYWAEPLVKTVSTKRYPNGKQVKEPQKAFLCFQEYLHLEYLDDNNGRSQTFKAFKKCREDKQC